jgi:hypothetical protein
VTRSLVPVDPVSAFFVDCSSSFAFASALLPSLSSFVPKVSREVYVCFRMFVYDSELRLGYRPSSSEKEFLAAPIPSPPLWFAVSVLHRRPPWAYPQIGAPSLPFAPICRYGFSSPLSLSLPPSLLGLGKIPDIHYPYPNYPNPNPNYPTRGTRSQVQIVIVITRN